MKYALTLILAIAVSLGAVAQPAGKTAAGFGVASTVPANGSTNVSTSTTSVVLTFTAAVDPSTFVLNTDGGPSAGMITNLDTITGIAFSGDYLTVTLTATLSSNTSYFVALYTAKSSLGEIMATPYVFYFTTGAAFPLYSVSGTVVASGSSGVSGAYALVAATREPIGGKNETFLSATQADGLGNFTLPYIGDGTLYLVAAKDLNNNGSIDPSDGDPVGIGPQVEVNGGNVTGVTIPLMVIPPITYAAAIDSLNTYIAAFPPGAALRHVGAYRVDADGGANDWEFDYIYGTQATSFRLRVEGIGCRIEVLEQNTYDWLSTWGDITSLPTVGAVNFFLSSSELNGGGAYRPQPPTWNGFGAEFELGSLHRGNYWDMISDQTKQYLGVTYWYGTEGQNQRIIDAQRRFLGDYTNGTILGVTAAEPAGGKELPASYVLGQNYPNPFNPATVIGYQLPSASHVRLEVFNILGERVASLVNGVEAPGAHQVDWKPQVASGVYLYRIEAVGIDNPAQHFIQVRKMVLMK